MTFCTAINCMDGRVQLPVIEFLKKRFDADFVDAVTEPGPNRALADRSDAHQIDSIRQRVDISVNKHGSRGIAIVGHHDCAGNLADDETQLDHLSAALAFLKAQYPQAEVIALWVDETWTVQEIAGL